MSTFQSKEQVLKTESENIKDLLQKEKDITAQNSLELEKLKISETSLQEFFKNKVEKEGEKKEHEKQVELLYDHAVYKPWLNYKKIKHFFI